MAQQLTVFLENTEGRLAKLCRALADAEVNMDALTLMDTAEYGVVRIICADPEAACRALTAQGYRASVTKICLVKLPNRPGALADLLAVLDALDIPVEYGYCFSLQQGYAVDALKIKHPDAAARAEAAIIEAGFEMLSLQDVAPL